MQENGSNNFKVSFDLIEYAVFVEYDGPRLHPTRH